jgi:replicative DNA helicase
MDLDILKVVQNKAAFERFYPLIKKHTVSSITWEILSSIKDYFENYPGDEEVNIGSFRTLFFIIKGEKIKNPDEYHRVFDNWGDKEVDEGVESTIIKYLVERDYATRIYNEAHGVAVGDKTKSMATIAEWMESYEKELGAGSDDTSLFVPPSLSYLVSAAVSGGLTWRLKELQVSLGPVRRGDFLIFAARPETGKTTMAASEVTNFLPQLAPDEYIYWVNNEEASNKVMMRCIQAHAQCTTAELLANPEHYEEAFKKAGGNRLLILDDDSGINDVRRLSSLFKTRKPGLIVFDQLDKVDGFEEAGRDDLVIGKKYKWAREIAKKYCPVIAISQVDGTGEGEKWIHMNQLRGSKTDKIGEADAIVTIGKSNEPGMDLQRFLMVPKNKLLGGPSTLEAHRHGAFEISIDPSRARYVSSWR